MGGWCGTPPEGLNGTSVEPPIPLLLQRGARRGAQPKVQCAAVGVHQRDPGSLKVNLRGPQCIKTVPWPETDGLNQV